MGKKTSKGGCPPNWPGPRYAPLDHVHEWYPPTVATIEERDNITGVQRYDGSIVYVEADQTTYQLRGGIENSFWTTLVSATGATSHTTLADIGVNTHAQIDTHLADATIHFTMASISITESQISDLQAYALASHGHAGVYLGVNDTAASTSALDTTSVAVNVDLAAPPVAGQVLTATSPTTATWQTPGAGGSGDIIQSGAPLNTYVGYFAGDKNLTGDAFFTWDTVTRLLSIAGPTPEFRIQDNNNAASLMSGKLSLWDQTAEVGSIGYLVSGGNLAIKNTAGSIIFDTDGLATVFISGDGNITIGGYIVSYAGAPADGEILTWVTANGRAEFVAAPLGITATGTPVANQIAVFDGVNSAAGDPTFTFTATAFEANGLSWDTVADKLTVGEGDLATAGIEVDGSLTGNPYLNLSQAGTVRGVFRYANTAGRLEISSTADDITLRPGNVDVLTLTASTLTAGTYIFDINQVLGAGLEGYVLTYDNTSGAISLEEIPALTEASIESALSAAAAFTVGNYTFNTDQVVGVTEDNFILTYDHASGEIRLEANAGGGGGGTIGGSITDNQIAVGALTANDIEGSANFTWDGSRLTIGATNPELVFNQTGAAVDEKLWMIEPSTGQLQHRAYADGFLSSTIYHTIDRTGTTIDSWILQNISIIQLASANVRVGDNTIAVPALTIDSTVAGSPAIQFQQNGVNKAYFQYQDTGDIFLMDADGEIRFQPSNTASWGYFTSTEAKLGNYVFDTDQVLGAGQDNYVLTYNDTTGTIQLEAATGGGGSIGGSITDNQIAVGATAANDIEGSSAFTWDASTLVVQGDLDLGATASLVYREVNQTLTVGGNNAGPATLSIRGNGAATLNLNFLQTGVAVVASIVWNDTDSELQYNGQNGPHMFRRSGVDTLEIDTNETTIQKADHTFITAASSTVRAGFRLPEGIAPTTPIDGDMWVTATDAFIRINGVNESIIGSGGSGNVSNSGTPVNNQLAVWVTATTIEGQAALTFDNTELKIGGGTLATPTVDIDSSATGNPTLGFSQGGVARTIVRFEDVSNDFVFNNVAGDVVFQTNSIERLGVSDTTVTYSNITSLIVPLAAPFYLDGVGGSDFISSPVDGTVRIGVDSVNYDFTAATATLGNYVFDTDQVVGAGTDNYVLTYDNTSGEIRLEVATGGGGSIGGSITDNQIAFGATAANDIEGSADLTWDGTAVSIGGAGPRINFGTNGYMSGGGGVGLLIQSDLGGGIVLQSRVNGSFIRMGADDSGGTFRKTYEATSDQTEIFALNGTRRLLIDDTGIDVEGQVNANGFYIADSAQAGWIAAPSGGYYHNGSGPQTGAIEITLPTARYNDFDLISFELTILDNDATGPIKLLISGRTNTGGAWINEHVIALSSVGGYLPTVRFGALTASSVYKIWVGELADSWNAMTARVTNLIVGENSIASEWASGWSIALEAAAFDTVDATIEPTFYVGPDFQAGANSDLRWDDSIQYFYLGNTTSASPQFNIQSGNNQSGRIRFNSGTAGSNREAYIDFESAVGGELRIDLPDSTASSLLTVRAGGAGTQFGVTTSGAYVAISDRIGWGEALNDCFIQGDADSIDFYVNNTNYVSMANDGIALASSGRIYFDGVVGTGDTYIVEGANNRLDFVVGGDLDALQISTTTATYFGVNQVTSGGDMLMTGYITQYAGSGTAAEGDVLAWNDTLGRVEFQTPAGGGGIGGSIADNQVAIGAATADNIEGSAALTYDATSGILTNDFSTGASLWLDSSATGNPYIYWLQAGVAKAYIQFTDVAEKLVIDCDGPIWLQPSNTVSAHEFNSANVVLGNYDFDTDQVVGAGQDNYVLTYDNTSGQISLEAAGGGGSPGGSDTQLQYNNGGSFGGVADLTYNDASPTTANLFTMTIPSSMTSGDVLECFNSNAGKTGRIWYVGNGNASSSAIPMNATMNGNNAAMYASNTNTGTFAYALQLESAIASRSAPLLYVNQSSTTGNARAAEIRNNQAGANLTLTGTNGKGIDMVGGILIRERADHAHTPLGGAGEVWVENTAPSRPKFTDDLSADHNLMLNEGGEGSFSLLNTVDFTNLNDAKYIRIVLHEYAPGNNTADIEVALGNGSFSFTGYEAGRCTRNITSTSAGTATYSASASVWTVLDVQNSTNDSWSGEIILQRCDPSSNEWHMQATFRNWDGTNFWETKSFGAKILSNVNSVRVRTTGLINGSGGRISCVFH